MNFGSYKSLIAEVNEGMSNPMSAAGDLIVGGSGGTPARLAKGSALQNVRINAAGTALEYADPAGGGIESRTSDYAAEAANVGKLWIRTDKAVPTIKTVIQYINPTGFDNATIDALSSNLQYVYRMEEQYDTRYATVGGENFDAYNMPTQVDGKFNNGVKLRSAQSSYLLQGVGSNFLRASDGVEAQDISVSFWIKFHSIGSGTQYLFDKYNPSPVRYRRIYFDESNGRIVMTWDDSSHSGTCYSQSSVITETDTWYHVVVLATGQQDTIINQIYVNAVAGTNVSTSSFGSSIDTPVYLGRTYDGSSYGNFTIDEIYQFNTIIDSDDISALFNTFYGDAGDVTYAVKTLSLAS